MSSAAHAQTGFYQAQKLNSLYLAYIQMTRNSHIVLPPDIPREYYVTPSPHPLINPDLLVLYFLL